MKGGSVVAMTTVGGEITLEYTSTWIIAGVYTIMILISLIVELVLHFIGKVPKKKNQKPLYESLLKVKEEQMLIGFISLVLVAFQGFILRICIPERITHNILPCNDNDKDIYNSTVTGGTKPRLLAGSRGNSTYCHNKIRQWKRWEEEIKKSGSTNAPVQLITQGNEFEFIKERCLGFGKSSRIMRWSVCYASLTRTVLPLIRYSAVNLSELPVK